MAARYRVDFRFPHDGSLIDKFHSQRILSLNYDRRINDISQANATLRGIHRLREWIHLPDLIMQVYRDNVEEGTYLVRYMNPVIDEEGREILMVTAFSPEHLIARRLVRPEDDPNGAGGFSTKQGDVGTVLEQFVTEQCVSPALDSRRIIDGLSVRVAGSTGTTAFERVQYDPLIEVVKRVANKGGMDWRVNYLADNNFEFEAGIFGQDRTRQNQEETGSGWQFFSTTRRNIVNPSLVYDRREEVNAVYVFGEGPEDDREIVEVNDFSMHDGRWNRIEGKADNRSNDTGDFEGFVIQGKVFLNEHAKKITFTFEVADREKQHYRRRWDLYDRVTGGYGDTEVELRIVMIKVSVGEDNEKMDIVLAETEIATIDPEIAILAATTPSEPTLALALKAIAENQKTRRVVNSLIATTAQAEWANASRRRTYDEVTTLDNPKIGQRFFVTDGENPATGLSTGVEATFDGTNWIVGDGSVLVT